MNKKITSSRPHRVAIMNMTRQRHKCAITQLCTLLDDQHGGCCWIRVGYFFSLRLAYICLSKIIWCSHLNRYMIFTFISDRCHPDITFVLDEHHGVSNHRSRDCVFNRLFRRRPKKTSKLTVTGLREGIHQWPVNSPHKGPVTRKMFLFDDVIMMEIMGK